MNAINQAASITDQQLHLLHHTLGLNPERRESYRNYFVAGPGHHDMPDLEALETAGLMRRTRPPMFLERGDVVFRCTDVGKVFAIEQLPPPPKRTKYDEYLRSDSCDSFAEWLGIVVPKLEVRTLPRHQYLYRYVRTRYLDNWYREEIAGEWCSTKKEAKASYKAELKRSKSAQKESYQ